MYNYISSQEEQSGFLSSNKSIIFQHIHVHQLKSSKKAAGIENYKASGLQNQISKLLYFSLQCEY